MKVINRKRLPLYLANNLISIAKEENISLTPIMLQKLIYFIFRDFYQLTDTALFKEKFETWKYGTAWFYANKEKCPYIELEFIDSEINKEQEKGE